MTCARRMVVAVIESAAGMWFGENACRRPQSSCPRGNMPSGTGYELCRDVCGQESHAEVSALAAAGEDGRGETLTLYGHDHCCADCLRAMRKAGIVEVVIAGTGERFAP